VRKGQVLLALEEFSVGSPSIAQFEHLAKLAVSNVR